MPVASLAHRFDASFESIAPYLANLIEKEEASILYGDLHPNPYIRALPDEPIEDQLSKLDSQKLEYACIYPQSKHLRRVVNQKQFEDSPYTLKIALGEPQYSFEFFDPALLDVYLQNSHCRVIHDIQSTLSSPGSTIRFTRAAVGSSYGIQFTNLLSANLQQLSLLSPTEQQYWHSMALPGPCTIHPSVMRTLIEGNFRDRVSIFEGLLAELHAVNSLCKSMQLPDIFLTCRKNNQVIKNFGFLPSPTLDSFHQFFLHFQILLLQNMNPAFLKAIEKPPYRTIQFRRKRKLERPSKTNLEHVSEWLNATCLLPNDNALARLASLIKKTRHELYERMYYSSKEIADHTLMHLQRKLMWYAYHALKLIRECFESITGQIDDTLHPLVREDRIWTI